MIDDQGDAGEQEEAIDPGGDSVGARVDFVPVANFNGQPPGLTTQVIENSAVAPLYGTETGLDLANAATPVAQAGVDVTGAGGTSSISATSEPLDIAVTAVNDAPVATGTATLAPADIGNGQTVTNLFGGNFSDRADQQRTPVNPSGSVADTLAGIAIVGDNANPTTQGVWRYSTDGGKSWQTINPETISPGSALVLPGSALVGFWGVSGYVGVPGTLNVALVETGNTLLSGPTAIVADVRTLLNDPSSSVSNTTVALGTTIVTLPQRGMPVLSGSTGADGLSSLATVMSSVDDTFTSSMDRGVAAAHQTWIVGSSLSSFVITEQSSDVEVPPGAFITPGGTERNLTLQAEQATGAPLPAWLSFDPQSSRFDGEAPEDTFGSLDVRVVGHDAFGHEASVDVHIVIGHDRLVSATMDPQPVTQAVQQGLGQVQTNVNALLFDTRLEMPQSPGLPAQGRAGFGEQLRQVGPMMRHHQARALLDRRSIHAPA
ncbi:hypothetical protein AA13595_2822 [Gluconacetobacter johannae DSM 13595]|uniref:Dystroglycan-type cadherin-like domain-containing protein n=1 Tax=Gluconacetobacter johannae TaxID=112140 RepID=A0A7W4P3W4_9PROT|nr:putative Ig domain-containing protein [Gluconacetobacter johannae]MBB2176457.1 hypothetical protein [Gluconacetobacter johannae]GBQ90134.1 hypothetical protein AA13595_2822 [Gluconacetobacter johannae DSM 13595]